MQTHVGFGRPQTPYFFLSELLLLLLLLPEKEIKSEK
jgi:hypothetical protein